MSLRPTPDPALLAARVRAAKSRRQAIADLELSTARLDAAQALLGHLKAAGEGLDATEPLPTLTTIGA